MRFSKTIFYIVFFSVFALLSGCYDEHQPAPVVDAWYQKNAASKFYVVQRDDTIYSIAFSFGLDYRDLVAVNHLSPPYTLTPGQRLIMTHRPPNSEAAVAPATPAQEEAPAPVVVQQQPVIVRAEQPSVVNPEENQYVAFNGRWGWPAKGRLLQGFSRNPSGHPGISIGGRLGEPIRASASGTVVYSGDGVRGYGNLIIIKHNDSYLSAYAFNQQNCVGVGDHVRAGQLIARMGQNDAGRTLLYFEIRRNGVPVDPLKFLR